MKKRLWLLLSGLCLLALCPQRASAQYYGVGVNIPMLLTGTVNASFEAAFAPHWSVDVPLMWNPIKSDKVQMRLLAIQPGVRYWFFEEYAGHFLAMHAALASYNVWNASHRHKGWLSGAGISYGYCWPLSARWNMTLEGGIGIYHMRESEKRRFTPDSEPEYIRHHRRWVFGPSKCALTFSYLF